MRLFLLSFLPTLLQFLLAPSFSMTTLKMGHSGLLLGHNWLRAPYGAPLGTPHLQPCASLRTAPWWWLSMTGVPIPVHSAWLGMNGWARLAWGLPALQSSPRAAAVWDCLYQPSFLAPLPQGFDYIMVWLNDSLVFLAPFPWSLTVIFSISFLHVKFYPGVCSQQTHSSMPLSSSFLCPWTSWSLFWLCLRCLFLHFSFVFPCISLCLTSTWFPVEFSFLRIGNQIAHAMDHSLSDYKAELTILTLLDRINKHVFN